MLQTAVIAPLRKAELKTFYENGYPFELLGRMLTREGRFPLAFREIVFQLMDDKTQKLTYARYQSFENVAAWRAATITHVPVRIEFGPAFDKCKPAVGAPVLGRELVFDLDAPDWADMREECCKANKTVCEKCWPLVRDAGIALDRILRQDFGWSQVHWFFSGRKGLHCWVLDYEAFLLTEHQRDMLVQYACTVPTEKSPASFSKPRKECTPRVDKRVTGHITHLLKSPFCIHEATRFISLPIPDLSKFSLSKSPVKIGTPEALATLKKMAEELNVIVKATAV
jgi:DNA primase small subunit